MNRLIQLQPHPFRLLLYLEWILLVIAILTEFPVVKPPRPPFFHPVHPQHLVLLFFSVAGFGIMGLKLPKNNLFLKILYTGLGFCLILFLGLIGGRGINFPPSLLLILVLRSCLVFKLIGRLLVAGLAFICFILNSVSPTESMKTIPPPLLNPLPPVLIPKNLLADHIESIVWKLSFNSALLFGLVLVFVLLLVNALLAERLSREELAITHEKLRQYALRIENQATLQERNRIAREIHDALGHALTAQSIQLENALLFLPSNLDKAKTFLLEAKHLGAQALQEVRQSVATLRFQPLQGKSLESAMAQLLTDFQRQTGIIPEYVLRLPEPLSPEVTTTIYRIVQEALTNISKHSGATQVKIDLQATFEHLYFQVEDNGKGFHPNENTTGFGLQGMRERTLALGGEFKIVSKPGDGCRIIAIFPYRG